MPQVGRAQAGTGEIRLIELNSAEICLVQIDCPQIAPVVSYCFARRVQRRHTTIRSASIVINWVPVRVKRARLGRSQEQVLAYYKPYLSAVLAIENLGQRLREWLLLVSLMGMWPLRVSDNLSGCTPCKSNVVT